MKILLGNDIRFPSRLAFWVVLGVCLLITVGLVGCETEEDRVLRANEAARQERSPVSRDYRKVIDVIELREGDCFLAPTTVDETGEKVMFTSFEVVPCTENWMYQILNSFVVREDGIFPGYEFFTGHALRQCPPQASIYLPPSVRTWNLGDRRVLCVGER